MIEHPRGNPADASAPINPLERLRRTARRVRWPTIGLAVILIVLGFVFRDSEQWGDIATWVTAITTLLAFIAAAFAGLVAYDLLKIEGARDWQAAQERALAAAERRREHASHISFWLNLHTVSYLPSGYEAEIVILLFVVNTSDRPARSVVALIGLRGDIWRDASTADGKELGDLATEWNTSVIAPGYNDSHLCPIVVPSSVAMIAREYGDDALIGELLFTDAGGTDWVQTFPGGRLIERQSPGWRDNVHLSLAGRDQQRRDASDQGDHH
jgi:hypothetical protein